MSDPSVPQGNIIDLPQSILYQAPGFSINTTDPRKRALIAALEEIALEEIGPAPTHANKDKILSGMELYEQVTRVLAYPYPRADYRIFEQHAGVFSAFIDGAIILELGVGGTEGGTKTGIALARIHQEYQKRPWALILNDQMRENVALAKEAIVQKNPAFPKNMIRSVTGDMFGKPIWKLINKQIDSINKAYNHPEGALPVFVLLQSPTYNDFDDGERAVLHESVFNLNSTKIVFCPAIDSTTDLELLNGAYNNPTTRQFALTAAAHYCWSHRIGFDPLNATSIVDIWHDDDGYTKIRHRVMEGSNEFRFEPIRKIPPDLLQREFEKAGIVTTHRFPYKNPESSKDPDPPKIHYAVYTLMHRGITPPVPAAA